MASLGPGPRPRPASLWVGGASQAVPSGGGRFPLLCLRVGTVLQVWAAADREARASGAHRTGGVRVSLPLLRPGGTQLPACSILRNNVYSKDCSHWTPTTCRIKDPQLEYVSLGD